MIKLASIYSKNPQFEEVWPVGNVIEMAVVDMNEWERGNREEMSVRSVSWRKHRLAWHLVLTAPFPQPPLPYTHKLHRLSNTRPFSGQCRKINSGKAALFSLLLFGYSEDAERYSRYQRQCHFSYVTTTVWDIKCEFLKTYYIQVPYVWDFFHTAEQYALTCAYYQHSF